MPTNPPLYGADVSSYQRSVDFKQAHQAGDLFAGVKFTEGNGYVNPFARQQWAAAAVLPVRIAYHFADARFPWTAKSEAANFIRRCHILGLRAGDMLVLDFETSGIMPAFLLRRWRDTFLAEVRAAFPHHTRGCYGGGWWASKGLGRPADRSVFQWRAAYGPSCPTLAPGWPVSFWQFTDGRIGPLPHSRPGVGPVDISKFLGTREELFKLAGIAAAASKPKPAPDSKPKPKPKPLPAPAPLPHPKPVPALRPTIKEGAKGPNVRAAQKALHVAADGIFGPKTKAAVEAFQRDHRLSVDGIIGPHTWRALGL